MTTHHLHHPRSMLPRYQVRPAKKLPLSEDKGWDATAKERASRRLRTSILAIVHRELMFRCHVSHQVMQLRKSNHVPAMNHDSHAMVQEIHWIRTRWSYPQPESCRISGVAVVAFGMYPSCSFHLAWHLTLDTEKPLIAVGWEGVCINYRKYICTYIYIYTMKLLKLDNTKVLHDMYY